MACVHIVFYARRILVQFGSVVLYVFNSEHLKLKDVNFQPKYSKFASILSALYLNLANLFLCMLVSRRIVMHGWQKQTIDRRCHCLVLYWRLPNDVCQKKLGALLCLFFHVTNCVTRECPSDKNRSKTKSPLRHKALSCEKTLSLVKRVLLKRIKNINFCGRL